MSFQHFRLEASFGPSPSFQIPGISLQPAASSSIPSIIHDPNTPASSRGQFQVQLNKPEIPQPSKRPATPKAPYGSGDIDDGYTMVFENMDAFEAWRRKEEEEKVVEFVKGDTHGSKANPPRFKDHIKLVCARHQRSGRKKYVKKHPERVRKVPSRKIEGVGCPASISFKTYFHTPEVRVSYISEHSHEIGLANLPFTRRGRKAQVEFEKEHKGRRGRPPKRLRNEAGTRSSSESSSQGEDDLAGASSTASYPQSHSAQQSHFSEVVSMLAPLPQFPPPATAPADMIERWERMGTLFDTVKQHARTFQYPDASVAALESVLIRLYLESPVHGSALIADTHRITQESDRGRVPSQANAE
ncbi:hypothetical protein GLOTRDRAFT_135072 [Gloeophyllum trabeum ATCC 11539]|uniref:Uncharacterized protein n=1 Tax=Gloeophyllum trabeum (strain ATCC 11539 / FP-39264 / Madison 617) TaxID=670483 RepID=S7QLQ8_GLOTA|nr:uncharacterized protein GLOTRDRAFT_135072 [Gloeophyllum trabeum ATCC 11539]EPQ60367.1 hypothetical protein GLOTRDRAFT_135072 [Gloeophyllum trabeum ATCC 11539]